MRLTKQWVFCRRTGQPNKTRVAWHAPPNRGLVNAHDHTRPFPTVHRSTVPAVTGRAHTEPILATLLMQKPTLLILVKGATDGETIT